MEAGYIEKVDELCDRYALKGLPKAQGSIYIIVAMELLLVCLKRKDAYNVLILDLLLRG